MSDQVALRLPEGMRDKLKMRAVANRRSLNSEIVVCLEWVIEVAEGDTNGDRT
ncbi:Arc family DNA-binding protein [Agrobacterium tumefaciens]|uniref:Arc family DNA-binding protein n=1 Tax=Agrobacterium tumefaciens TaxID=358 RepID=UPI0009B650A0